MFDDILWLKDPADIAAHFATVLGVVIGGIWAWLRFWRTGEAHAKLEFNVDLIFVHTEKESRLAEVVAIIENNGYVRCALDNAEFSLTYSLPNDIEAPPEDIKVPPKKEEAPKVKAKDAEKSPFLFEMKWQGATGMWFGRSGQHFFEGGIKNRYGTAVTVPAKATSVMVSGKIFYAPKFSHSANKLVAVPKENTPPAVPLARQGDVQTIL